jgi:hypothetical protein
MQGAVLYALRANFLLIVIFERSFTLSNSGHGRLGVDSQVIALHNRILIIKIE